MYSWSNENISDCKNNDWLLNSSVGQWTISPNSSNSRYVFVVRNSGYVYSNSAGYSFGECPVVYLLSDIQYTQGIGSQEDPFVFSL